MARVSKLTQSWEEKSIGEQTQSCREKGVIEQTRSWEEKGVSLLTQSWGEKGVGKQCGFQEMNCSDCAARAASARAAA